APPGPPSSIVTGRVRRPLRACPRRAGRRPTARRRRRCLCLVDRGAAPVGADARSGGRRHRDPTARLTGSGAVLGSGKLAGLRALVGGAAATDEGRDGDPDGGDLDVEGDQELDEAQAEAPDEVRDGQPAAPGAIDVVLVDHEISPSQARNLEKATGVEVMDRTAVILEIFRRHARSRAAKAQVEIVRLQYLVPRLREQGKAKGKDRQRGGIGGKGAGESSLELDRRKIRDRIAELTRELDAMAEEQRTQRARRRDMNRVALVGYTNAGKSTLMRALTGSDVLVADKLFATLDTTVRPVVPATRPRVLVSDTVGFIDKLPHGLVASLRARSTRRSR